MPCCSGGRRRSPAAGEQKRLQTRLATVGTGDALVREARRLGLVKPGERLFIVRGIAAWRQSTDRSAGRGVV